MSHFLKLKRIMTMEFIRKALSNIAEGATTTNFIVLDVDKLMKSCDDRRYKIKIKEDEEEQDKYWL